MKFALTHHTTSDWQALQKGLRSFVYHRLPQEAVEDVVSDIIETIIQKKSDIHLASNPSAWIYAVARSKVADFYRRQGREHTALQTLNSDPTLLNHDEPYDKPGLHDCVMGFIGRLSKTDQTILEEIDIKGTRQTDFAHRNAIALPTVKSRVQRARNRLRDRLIACCPTGTEDEGEDGNGDAKTCQGTCNSTTSCSPGRI
jgi:RNA polymerase sigma-70 factor (ECF subfamily)